MRKVKYLDGVYYGETVGLFKPKKHGEGRMNYTNGDVYEGQWKNDKRDGKGKLTYANGDVLYGTWRNGFKLRLI